MFIGGQRRKCIGSIKRVAVLIAVVFVALIVDTVSGRGGIQAKAADANQIVKSGELGNITWTLDKNGLMTLASKEGTNGHFGTGDSYPANTKWFALNERKLVKRIEISNKIHADNLSHMFYFFTSLKSIDGIENLDTSSTVNMSDMFTRCDELSIIDVSHFDTSNVTDMSNMFDSCNIKELDVSNFDTSNVINMDRMFGANFDLQSLNLGRFDTSNVINMSEMFVSCRSLKTIDVGRFDTSKVEYMEGMFSNCYSLEKIDVSNFDTKNVRIMAYMFDGCNSLTYLDLSNFDTSGVINNLQEHLNNIKNQVFGWDYDMAVLLAFNNMFPILSQSKLRTIVIGPKCDTFSTVIDGTIYKYGIQYSLPYIADDDSSQYIIRRQDSKYGVYNYSLKRDINKKYHDGRIYGLNTFYYCDSAYDSDFADAWKPEKAGAWTIEKANVKYTIVFMDGLTNTNISSVQANRGSTVETPIAPAHDGYEFVSWNNKDKLMNIQSDATVTAIYKKIEKPNDNVDSSDKNNSGSGNTNINGNQNDKLNLNTNIQSNQIKQTVPQVKSNNSRIDNEQSNELEQTGIDINIFFVSFIVFLSVNMIVWRYRRSK